jgi:hypothetical protein
MSRMRIGAMSCITIGTLLTTLMVLAPMHNAVRPRTHREAVTMVLRQHALPYDEVDVHSVCTFDPRDCAFLSADTMHVTVHASRQLDGRIVCRRGNDIVPWSDCTLTVEALQLHDVPLPALARAPEWVLALQRQLRPMEAWLRTWLSVR